MDFEGAIPLIGTDEYGGKGLHDYSDINVRVGDILGFSLYSYFGSSDECGASKVLSSTPDYFNTWDALTWTNKVVISNDTLPAPIFRRGDADADEELNITDAISILRHLFLGTATPACRDAADTNDDGQLNLTDAVYLLNYLFKGSIEPPAPGTINKGTDPTLDSLDCQNYP